MEAYAPNPGVLEGFDLPAAKELAFARMGGEASRRFRNAMRQPVADALFLALVGYAGAHVRRLVARRELDAAEAEMALRASAEASLSAYLPDPVVVTGAPRADERAGGSIAEESEAEDEAESAAAGGAAAGDGEDGASKAAILAQLGASTAELASAEAECAAALRDLGAAYASLLFRHAAARAHEGGADRAFFERLLAFSVEVLRCAFDAAHWAALEDELDRLFRSAHFNTAARRNAGERRLLPARELHALKSSGDAFKQQPAAASAHSRRSSVRTALTQRSPALAHILPTPEERLAQAQAAHEEYIAAAKARARDSAQAHADAARAHPPARAPRHAPAVSARLHAPQPAARPLSSAGYAAWLVPQPSGGGPQQPSPLPRGADARAALRSRTSLRLGTTSTAGAGRCSRFSAASRDSAGAAGAGAADGGGSVDGADGADGAEAEEEGRYETEEEERRRLDAEANSIDAQLEREFQVAGRESAALRALAF